MFIRALLVTIFVPYCFAVLNQMPSTSVSCFEQTGYNLWCDAGSMMCLLPEAVCNGTSDCLNSRDEGVPNNPRLLCKSVDVR